ncbi:MAG: hypothetical protein U0103_09395 [Candidatus Obscuribacterales bacterium]|nr:hypothetical protein [Cyanobacteria bacterium SZAS LIN-5]
MKTDLEDSVMMNEQATQATYGSGADNSFSAASNFLFNAGRDVANYYEGKTDLFTMGRDILGNTRDGAFAIFGAAGDRMTARFDPRNTFNNALLNGY